MKVAIEDWLKEPQAYCQVSWNCSGLRLPLVSFPPWRPAQGILDKFDFLIDGRAKKQIEVFIKKKPKFEEICKELEVLSVLKCDSTFFDFLKVFLQIFSIQIFNKSILSLKVPTKCGFDCAKIVSGGVLKQKNWATHIIDLVKDDVGSSTYPFHNWN